MKPPCLLQHICQYNHVAVQFANKEQNSIGGTLLSLKKKKHLRTLYKLLMDNKKFVYDVTLPDRTFREMPHCWFSHHNDNSVNGENENAFCYENTDLLKLARINE
jgi:hypothetical protein